ncbi:MAG TPA: hypothetical protein V6D47_07210 [Oscillatoriaceae cyanobacterium]
MRHRKQAQVKVLAIAQTKAPISQLLAWGATLIAALALYSAARLAFQ